MIKVKDGYGKLIGTTYLGVSDRVLLSNGGDFGLHTERNNEANKIVRTDANGEILAGWINTTSGGTTATINKIYCSTDDYIRYKTPANFFETFENSGNLVSLTIGSYNRKLTVNYANTSNTLNNLGRKTAISGTTLGENGLRLYSVYANGYPVTYGNVLNIGGGGYGELLCLWTDNSTPGHLYYRSKRDVESQAWSNWVTILDNNNYPSTLDNRYVTLTTNLTISGVKTFSTQLKFTVATGTSPFTVSSTTVVSNLNADLLDGNHSTSFKRVWWGNAGKSYIGWIKLIEWKLSNPNHFSPYPFTLYIYRNFNSPSSESYTLQCNFGWGNASINQIGGKAGDRIIEKFRISKTSDNLTYFLEMYVNTSYTTYQNTCTFVMTGHYNEEGKLLCEVLNAPVTSVNEITTNANFMAAAGYFRNGSSDDYVLLGGGGHLSLSNLPSIAKWYWANIPVSNTSSNITQPTFYNTRILGANPNLYIKNTNSQAESYSIIRFGNHLNDNGAYIFLNGPTRTNDGGNNMMTIRNNVGNLRLDNSVLITQKLDTPKLRIIGTTENPNWNSAGAITWTEDTNNSQAVSLVYTSYDTYRAPAGLKLIGSLGNEWLEAPRLIKSGSNDNYILLGGGGHKLLSELSSSNHNHDNVYWKVNGLTTKGTGDIYLEMWRGTNASWKILNSNGNLYFQNNFVNSAGSYFNVLTLNYNTGHAIFKGDIICNLLHRDGKSVNWVDGRKSALLRETTSVGYHALWSLKTTNGSWDFGEYNISGQQNIPILTYITDSNYNSGNNTVTHQIRFPLASGTVALTSLLPTVTNYYWANIKVSSSPLITTSPTFASVKAIAAGGPHFEGRSSAGNWAYLRLHNSSNYWDIATNTSSGSAGLWLSRYNGGEGGIFVSTTKRVGINTSSPSDVLNVAGLLRLDSSNIHLRLGPQNGSYAHYSTNAPIGHWFNTNVEVLGICRPYGNNKYSSGDSANRWSNVYSYAGNFIGQVSITYNSYPGLTVHNNTSSGESSIYIKNNTAGWALGVNTWSVGASEFAIGQYSGSGSSNWRFRINNSGYCYTSSYLNLGAGNEKNASSPPYIWGVNGSDNFLRTYDTTSLRVGYASDSDKLDGYHRQGLYSSIPEWISANRYTKSITINGDSSTYYPVVIDTPISKQFPGFISVWKDLGSPTASYPGNHSNGTASMWLLYECRKTFWDGNGGYFKCLYRSMPYSNLCAKAGAGSNGSGRLIVYLRGGGTLYNISTTYGVTVDVYMSHTNIESSQYPVYVTPTSTLGNLGIFSTSYAGYGDITGSSASVRDVLSGNLTTFAYSKSTMAYGDFTYLAGWNGYELRAVNKNIFAASSHSHAYLPLAGGTMNTNAKIICNTSSTNTEYGGALEIREYNYVTSSLSSWAYAPGITFHWGGKVVGKLGLRSDGLIAYKDVPLSLNTHNHNSSYVTSLGTNGNYLTWTKNGTTNNITIPYASSSDYTNRLKVLDVRDATRDPNYFASNAVTAWFNQTGTPDGNWYSGLHVKGWHSGYSSWELCSYSSTGTANNYRLYHRNGNNSTWGSWKTIAYTSDLTWGNISNKPSSFTPSSHTHPWSLITGAPVTATRWPNWDEITNKPTIPDISNLVTLNTTQTITANKTFNSAITFGGSDSYGIYTSKNNYCTIGTSDKAFYKLYVNGILPGSSSVASSVIGSASTPFKNAFLDKITSKIVLLRSLTTNYSNRAYVEYEIYLFSHVVVVSGSISCHGGVSGNETKTLTTNLPIPIGSYKHAGIFYSKGGGSALRQVKLYVNGEGELVVVWELADSINWTPYSFAYLTNDLTKI